MKEVIKRVTLVNYLARKIKRKFLVKLFPESRAYWIQRYGRAEILVGGSYNKLAEFKAEIINGFVKSNSISTIIEYSCGGGNQSKLAIYPNSCLQKGLFLEIGIT